MQTAQGINNKSKVSIGVFNLFWDKITTITRYHKKKKKKAGLITRTLNHGHFRSALVLHLKTIFFFSKAECLDTEKLGVCNQLVFLSDSPLISDKILRSGDDATRDNSSVISVKAGIHGATSCRFVACNSNEYG